MQIKSDTAVMGFMRDNKLFIHCRNSRGQTGKYSKENGYLVWTFRTNIQTDIFV